MLDLGRLVLWQKIRMVCFYFLLGIAASAFCLLVSKFIAIVVAIGFLIWLSVLIQVNVCFGRDSITYRNVLKTHSVAFEEIQHAFVDGGNYLLSWDWMSLGIALKSGSSVRILGIPTLIFNKERYLRPIIEWINWRVSDDYDSSIQLTLSEISESRRLSRKSALLIAGYFIVAISLIIGIRVKFVEGSGIGMTTVALIVGQFIYFHAESLRDKNINESKTFSEIVKSRSA